MDDARAELVLDWYCDLEDRFSRLLGIVPFTDKTKDTFLPGISSIILEAASLMDTVFRNEYRGRGKRNDLTIIEFAEHYESLYGFSNRQSVLFRHPVRYINPFKGWTDKNGKYSELAWWKAYNKLKHDRLSNYEMSTLTTALYSLCALHQAIAVLPCFAASLFRRDMIICGSWNPKYVADIMSKVEFSNDHDVHAAFETELFCSSTIAGSFPSDIMRLNVYLYGPSRLFRHLAHLDRSSVKPTTQEF